jgi:alkaline phosphatase D
MAHIVQISDPHVSRARPFFSANFERALRAAAALTPDAVIVTGDLTIDGADSADDLVYARELAEAVSVPVYCLPGNHDAGEEPGSEDAGQPINTKRLTRYLDVFGTDRHTFRLGEWQIIGLNSQLFGTGLEAEGAQWEWLLGALRDAAGSPIAFFLHKPLFIGRPGEPVDGKLSIPAAARNRLMGMAKAHNIRFFASGHLHQALIRAGDEPGHIWAPSCGFAIETRRAVDADTRVGMVSIRLEPGGVWSACLIHPPELEHIDYKHLLAAGPYRSLRDLPAVGSNAA